MAGPRMNRRKWAGIKLEASKGVAEELTGADAKLLVFDLVVDQAINFEDRAPAGLTMGRLAGIPEEYLGRATFRTELRGSGVAGTLPVWTRLLRIAGFGVSGTTFSLRSAFDDQSTGTFVAWDDGVRKLIYGCAATFRITGENARRLFMEWDLMGVWTTPIDEAAPSITHESAKPPRFAAATFSIGSAHPKISRFELEHGAQVEMRPDVENEDGSGVAHAYIADRLSGCRFDPEARLVADDDIFGRLLAGTEQALSVVIGSGTGNRIRIAAPRLQVIEPANENRRGLQVYNTRYQFNALAGDDEYTIQVE